MIEKYKHDEKGYLPCLIKTNWQAAILNFAEEQDPKNIDKIEKHSLTDELFVLLHGNAVLIAADVSDNEIIFKTEVLEKGIIYNIPQDVWHNIAMEKNTKIFIFENANTHLNDCTYLNLNDRQQKELYSKIADLLI